MITLEKLFIGDNRDEQIKKSIITVQELPTTLNKIKKDDGSITSTAYTTNDYDHFSYTQDMAEKMQLATDRIDAVHKYFGDEEASFAEYFKKVSDHVPVSLTVNVKKGAINLWTVYSA